MEAIIEVKPLENYLICIRFAYNFSAKINIKPFISTGISTKLLDYD